MNRADPTRLELLKEFSQLSPDQKRLAMSKFDGLVDIGDEVLSHAGRMAPLHLHPHIIKVLASRTIPEKRHHLLAGDLATGGGILDFIGDIGRKVGNFVVDNAGKLIELAPHALTLAKKAGVI